MFPGDEDGLDEGTDAVSHKTWVCDAALPSTGHQKVLDICTSTPGPGGCRSVAHISGHTVQSMTQCFQSSCALSEQFGGGGGERV